VSYFQKCRKTLAQPNGKDENENHFKNGNKGQKRFNKNVEKFCWE
jgi:hypothetical protein